MRVEHIRERLLQERSTALDIRDPLAIRRAGDRYKTIMGALSGWAPTTDVDPDSVTLNLRDAAKALGLTMREIRAMVHEQRLPSRRVGGELRVPLSAVL